MDVCVHVCMHKWIYGCFMYTYMCCVSFVFDCRATISITHFHAKRRGAIVVSLFRVVCRVVSFVPAANQYSVVFVLVLLQPLSWIVLFIYRRNACEWIYKWELLLLLLLLLHFWDTSCQTRARVVIACVDIEVNTEPNDTHTHRHHRFKKVNCLKSKRLTLRKIGI